MKSTNFVARPRKQGAIAALLVALALALLVFQPTPADAVARQSSLSAGQQLSSNASLWSPSGWYEARMQQDGNFVVYNTSGVAQWASGTGVAGSVVRLQSDGNLVIYSTGGAAIWSTATAPSSGNALVMQDDGNLVLYSRGGLGLWASRGGRSVYSQNSLPTEGRLSGGQSLWSPSGWFEARMQQDGNFVVYNTSGVSQWASGTGVAGSYVRLQSDGNLVIYAAGGSAVWSSSTAPSSGTSLVMQDDGNLVLYSGSRALWASRSGGTTSASSYPDDDAIDCSGQFGVYSWCKGGKQNSSRGFGYRNCTDFVSWRLGLSWGAVQAGNDGNARAWKQGWINRGRSVGTTPRVGAVAWWGTSRGGGFGHVAVVLKVNNDGSAQIAQYNAAGTGRYSEASARAESYLY